MYRVVVDEAVEDAVRHLPASLLLPYAEVLATENEREVHVLVLDWIE